nr:DsbA family protein [Desulfosediminicola ganghwensis]
MRWRAFPLHPETPDEGILLEELFKTGSDQIDRMVTQLRLTANQLGLPFGNRTKTYNSRLAQELGLWAEKNGRGEEFHLAAFKAYFADGRNLAKQHVLLDLAKSCNLPIEEASEVLRTRSYATAVDEDWEASRQQQITAVPTFTFGSTLLVGAQAYSNLQGLMLQHGVLRR